jgi:hypothetical protein
MKGIKAPNPNDLVRVKLCPSELYVDNFEQPKINEFILNWIKENPDGKIVINDLQRRVKKAFEKTLDYPQGDYQKGYKQAMEDLKKEILGE